MCGHTAQKISFRLFVTLIRAVLICLLVGCVPVTPLTSPPALVGLETQHAFQDYTRSERGIRERHMTRDTECKLRVREDKKGGGGLVCERGKEEEHQACVHNEQDELKGEQREMRGIQKCSQRGKRELSLYVCVRESMGREGESKPKTEGRG